MNNDDVCCSVVTVIEIGREPKPRFLVKPSTAETVVLGNSLYSFEARQLWFVMHAMQIHLTPLSMQQLSLRSHMERWSW